MSNYRERRHAGHYEPTTTPEPDTEPPVDDEDEDEESKRAQQPQAKVNK